MASGAKKRKKEKREGEGEREGKKKKKKKTSAPFSIDLSSTNRFQRSFFLYSPPFPLSLFFPLFTRASQGEGTRGYEKADVRRMQMNTVRGNDQLFHSVLLMFARCGFAVHAFWIFAGWNGFRGGSLFGKKFGEEWSHSRSLVEFFFFLERLERIVSFLFFVHLLSFVVVRINVEFVKLTVEYGYCVLVSLEINLFIIRGLF